MECGPEFCAGVAALDVVPADVVSYGAEAIDALGEGSGVVVPVESVAKGGVGVDLLGGEE